VQPPVKTAIPICWAAGLPAGETVITLNVPVETKVYHTSSVQVVCPHTGPVDQVVDVAPADVPVTQALPVEGIEIRVAPVQLSLAGWLYPATQIENNTITRDKNFFILR
jgi:hypothetical protein